MEPFFWAALGFLVVAAVGGGILVGLRGWRLWQAFASLTAGVGGGLDSLLTGAERLAAHAERSAEHAQELTAAVERLRTAERRSAILLGAAGEVRDTARAVLAFRPQK